MLREKASLHEGHGFSRAVKGLRTTALQAAEKLGFVSGHDFSRAVDVACALDGFKPCHTDSVGEGFRQMGKRHLTKGTGSAVP
jgi:hypothetical protein